MSGAIGLRQLKKLPSMLAQRRSNALMFKELMIDHPFLLTQEEIGSSSWFGFSLIIKPDSDITRKSLMTRLDKLGFEYRPIVAGNFTRNACIKYFQASIPSSLPGADTVHDQGLFIGNHHYPLTEAIIALSKL